MHTTFHELGTDSEFRHAFVALVSVKFTHIHGFYLGNGKIMRIPGSGSDIGGWKVPLWDKPTDIFNKTKT